MSMQQTIEKLYEMKMSTMARAYRDFDESNQINDMSFDEKLAMLVDAEWDARRINKRIRLLRQAAFCAPDANLLDVCYDEDRKLDKDMIARLSTCDWIKDAHNLIITGATGAGKSWIACAFGVCACNMFYTVRYIRLAQMLDDLCVKKDEEWLKTKQRYIKCDLLIIDDWMLEALDHDQARETLEIVEERNRHKSTIFCSQFPSSAWSKKMGESAVAEARIDRIVNNSHVIHIEGKESMRKRMSTIS